MRPSFDRLIVSSDLSFPYHWASTRGQPKWCITASCSPDETPRTYTGAGRREGMPPSPFLYIVPHDL